MVSDRCVKEKVNLKTTEYIVGGGRERPGGGKGEEKEEGGWRGTEVEGTAVRLRVCEVTWFLFPKLPLSP